MIYQEIIAFITPFYICFTNLVFIIVFDENIFIFFATVCFCFIYKLNDKLVIAIHAPKKQHMSNKYYESIILTKFT